MGVATLFGFREKRYRKNLPLCDPSFVAMQRFHQLIFVASLLALSWFAMMAVHELGHVVGALVTGGVVERVVLHPLTISRTDVSPNPEPSIVVWLARSLDASSLLPSGGLFPDTLLPPTTLQCFLLAFV